MSLYDEFTSCPQCAGVATATFNNRANSREVRCNHCGYSEYRGPKYNEQAFIEVGTRVVETLPGRGAFCFTSADASGITTIRQFKREQDLENAKRVIEDGKIPFSWYRLTSWEEDAGRVVVLAEFLTDGCSVPWDFRGQTIADHAGEMPEES